MGRFHRSPTEVKEPRFRREVTLTRQTRERLEKWAELQTLLGGKRVTMAAGIHDAIAGRLAIARNVEEHEYAADKVELRIYFSQTELTALSAVCHIGALGVSRGAVIEWCLLKMWDEEDQAPRADKMRPS